VLFYCIDRFPRFIGGAHDSRGNGQYLGEVAAQRYGFYKIKQVMLSTQWYLDNFPRYKAAHEDHQIILPADSDLLDDHRQVVVERGIPKIRLLPSMVC
jgi:phage FluMu gp28-like protein